MTSNKPYICVLSFENINLEYRVRNQVNFLSKFYNIDFVGIGDWEPLKDINFKKINKFPKTMFFYFMYGILLIIGRLIPYAYKYIFKLRLEYREAKKLIQSRSYEIVHANDWDALFVVMDAGLEKNSKIIFDAHELSTEQQSELFLWRILIKPFRNWVFKKYLSEVDKIITVSDSIAMIYEKDYSIKKISVIYNARNFVKNKFKKVNPKRIKIIHHGAAIRNRSLEKIIELSDLLDDRFKISLMLIPHDNQYFRQLNRLCNKHSNEKIEIIDFVEYSKITNILIDYDIGIPAIVANNKNHLYALGSKFFDYIMAGLAIAVPPMDAYKEMVEENQNGVVGIDMGINSLANILNNTPSNQFNRYKRNSLRVAKRLNLEQENKKLKKIYYELLSG